MFERARIKLTAWYLLIIMAISVFFSMVIYRGLTSELARLERVEHLRLERRQPELLFTAPGLPPTFFDPDVVAETRRRIVINLFLINALIFCGSAVAGYFLAGRTLMPIAQMLEEQNRFITDASHELRTPLTSLKSQIEVNLRNRKMTLEDAKKLLMSNLEDVNSLSSLSDGLIKLTQYQQNGGALPTEKIHIPVVVKEAVRRVSAAAKEKHISVSYLIPELSVHANAALLTELMVILLDNAVKYSPKNRSVSVTAEKTDGHVRIAVRDHGIGIHTDDILHLFDRFYRADKSRTKTDVTGYGLGLAIARQIADRHGGSIHVVSAVGKGSTFTVEIPVRHAA